jgi:hypothetical protein
MYGRYSGKDDKKCAKSNGNAVFCGCKFSKDVV